jgi:biotin carboxylase
MVLINENKRQCNRVSSGVMKTILILGAGIEQTIAIELAKKMGLKVIAVDVNPNAQGLKIADVGINADIKSVKAMIEIGKKYKIDGVMTHAVEIPQVIAKVAKVLNLPCLDPEIAERATNKLERIKCLTKHGISCPNFETAKTVEEAKRKTGKIGFPCVFKPIDSAGARGVKKVRRIEEVENAFKEALYNSKRNKIILIEEFLEGKEISTESVIYQNKIITTGFGDRNYSRKEEFEPYFVEDGHNVPSSIPEKVKEEVLKTVNSAIKALGINWGVAKGDILIKDNSVYILEMAARTSGGWFCAGTVPIATGVNILKSLIKMSIGEFVKEIDLRPKYNKAACQRYIIPTEDGIFEKIEGIEKAKRMPGVKMFVIFNMPKKGELIKKATNHSERFGQLIAEGENIEDAIAKCENAMNLIKIMVKK